MMEDTRDDAPSSEGSDEERSGIEPPKDPAKLAREAMERARASARQRGARQVSAGRGRTERERRRRIAESEGSPQPYGKGREPRHMGDAVESLLRRMGWMEQVEVASVTVRWREVIGDQIADNCEPLSFEDGVLVVKASSTAWATQLQIMSGQIKHRINEEFGRDVVLELKVLGPAQKSWKKGPRSVKGRGPRDTYG